MLIFVITIGLIIFVVVNSKAPEYIDLEAKQKEDDIKNGISLKTREKINLDKKSIPMKMEEWLITFLVMAIPIIGFIFLIIWATGNDVNLNKKTFSQASLICCAITFVLYILFWMPLVSRMMNMF